jgi:hypothetical protein
LNLVLLGENLEAPYLGGITGLRIHVLKTALDKVGFRVASFLGDGSTMDTKTFAPMSALKGFYLDG